MGMRIAKNTTILLVVLFAAAAVVLAQTSTGEVNGTVADNSGGAISGAAVKLANPGTKVTRKPDERKQVFCLHQRAAWLVCLDGGEAGLQDSTGQRV